MIADPLPHKAITITVIAKKRHANGQRPATPLPQFVPRYPLLGDDLCGLKLAGVQRCGVWSLEG
jgi:hypothetical protein